MRMILQSAQCGPMPSSMNKCHPCLKMTNTRDWRSIHVMPQVLPSSWDVRAVIYIEFLSCFPLSFYIHNHQKIPHIQILWCPWHEKFPATKVSITGFCHLVENEMHCCVSWWIYFAKRIIIFLVNCVLIECEKKYWHF